mmetsp:Transcript_82818/g.198753  ORF Transcript_82818/g.198753 Transcript_82818/m.198753 type:complete len:243 (+) Transcript_82818:1109-1837(+)
MASIRRLVSSTFFCLNSSCAMILSSRALSSGSCSCNVSHSRTSLASTSSVASTRRSLASSLALCLCTLRCSFSAALMHCCSNFSAAARTSFMKASCLIRGSSRCIHSRSLASFSAQNLSPLICRNSSHRIWRSSSASICSRFSTAAFLSTMLRSKSSLFSRSSSTNGAVMALMHLSSSTHSGSASGISFNPITSLCTFCRGLVQKAFSCSSSSCRSSSSRCLSNWPFASSSLRRSCCIAVSK